VCDNLGDHLVGNVYIKVCDSVSDNNVYHRQQQYRYCIYSGGDFEVSRSTDYCKFGTLDPNVTLIGPYLLVHRRKTQLLQTFSPHRVDFLAGMW